MKNRIIQISCSWAFLLFSQTSAQPPTYQFASAYEISIAPDTLRQYFLLDANQDSVPDLLFATLDSIWVLDGANGARVIEPIPMNRRGFVFIPHRESTGNLILYFAYADSLLNNQHVFRIIHFPLMAPAERDSFFVTAPMPLLENPFFQGLTYILPFDIGNDGVVEFLLFYNYSSYMATIGTYYTGFYAAFDREGNLIRDTTERHRLVNISAFKLSGGPVFSIMDYSAFYSYWGGDDIRFALETLDDSLLRVDFDTVPGGNFKHLKNDADSVEMMIQYYYNTVSFYDNPFLSGGLSRSFPCAAIPNFYHIGESLFLLVGCPNSYFELRDLQMNLVAFIWGPNISISDADAVDIDRDGTDELLCRTSTGFVVYRLDTTSVSVADDDFPLPGRVSISAYPNPFNSAVTISLSGFDGDAEIAIYDIAGRLVRTLRAVERRAIWDGRNENGAGVQSGIYFIRASLPDAKATCQIALIR